MKNRKERKEIRAQKKASFTPRQILFRRMALFLCVAHFSISALLFLDMLFTSDFVIIHNVFYYFFSGVMPFLTTVATAAVCCAFVLRDKKQFCHYVYLFTLADAISSCAYNFLHNYDELISQFTFDYVLFLSLWQSLLDILVALLILAVSIFVSYLIVTKRGEAVYLEKFTFFWSIFMLIDVLIAPVGDFISLCLEAGGILYASEILLFIFTVLLCIFFAFVCLITFKKTYLKIHPQMQE